MCIPSHKVERVAGRVVVFSIYLPQASLEMSINNNNNNNANNAEQASAVMGSKSDGRSGVASAMEASN
jgi:hypothetical protein